MANYLTIFENALIITVGMLLHFKRISVIDLKYWNQPALEPNIASMVFVLSSLGILTKLRTACWPSFLKKHRSIAFFFGLGFSLYATDFLVRHLWIPALRMLYSTIQYMSQHVFVYNGIFLSKHPMPIAKWMSNGGYYWARFGLAMCAFIFMISVTECLGQIKQKINFYEEKSHRSVAIPCNLSEGMSIDEYTAHLERLREDPTDSVAERRKQKRRNSRKRGRSSRRRSIKVSRVSDE